MLDPAMDEHPARLRRPFRLAPASLAVAGAGLLSVAPPAATAAAPAAPAVADADDPFARTVEAGGIDLRIVIRSTSYAWTITNRVGSSVREVAIPVAHTAGIVPPEGWSYTVEDDVLRLTADRAGLRVGTSMTVSAQTPFDLARVTTGTITVVRLDGETIELAGAWVPGRKRAPVWWLVAGGVAGLGLLHLAVVEVRTRRRRSAAG